MPSSIQSPISHPHFRVPHNAPTTTTKEILYEIPTDERRIFALWDAIFLFLSIYRVLSAVLTVTERIDSLFLPRRAWPLYRPAPLLNGPTFSITPPKEGKIYCTFVSSSSPGGNVWLLAERDLCLTKKKKWELHVVVRKLQGRCLRISLPARAL